MTDEKEVLELLLKYVSDWNCASADEYPYFTDELGHACNDAIKLIDYKNKESTKLKADVEQFSNELISVRIENELLKKKNELTNHYFKQYAAAIDEVEQLKEDYSLLSRQYDNVENSSIRYYNEVKQLKSELEQSVKLPCKVGDNIYFRVKGRNQFAEYVDFIQTQKITRIYIDEDGTLYCSATEKFTECDINKTIFLTREEAERHLKGKVENDKLRTN